MKFAAYIKRQQDIIRRRHVGEALLVCKGEISGAYDRDRLLDELENLRGLNKAERLSRGAAAVR